MKRTDAVQLIVIGFAVMCAYQCIIAMPQFLMSLILWFDHGLTGDSMETIIITIIVIAIFAILAIYGIRYSKRIAESITRKAFTGTPPTISLNVTETLFVALAGIAIYGLIETVPNLCVMLYTYFKTDSPRGAFEFAAPKPTNKMLFLQLFTACLYYLLLHYAHVFAEVLTRKMKKEDSDIAEEEAGIIGTQDN